MAHSLSARKRVRQNATHNAYNRWRLRNLRDSLKAFEDKFVHGDAAGATEAFRAACQLLDKSASKKVIHKNTAARKKSRLSARLKGMGKGGPTTKAKK
ncbi:MAG: 30S ribosomal protein S20 [Phycisphaerales bacterium]